MGRTAITSTTVDLTSDNGNALWSLVQGEQLEFPVVLNFLSIATSDYTFEAVVMEADNVLNDEGIPTKAKLGGVTNTLTVRVPTYKGAWAAATAYNGEDVVYYATTNKYYKLKGGLNYVNATTPDLDPVWEEHLPNTVYVQFTATLGTDWIVQPQTDNPVYGFFELSVQEPATVTFRRTWKPVRGLVEYHYSPTFLV